MSEFVYLAHYHEIALKGKNRGMFEEALRKNIAKATSLPLSKIHFMASRFVIESGDEEIEEKLSHVFGLSSFSRALMVKPEIGAIKKAALSLVGSKKFSSFAVAASRGDKNFPLTSVEINQEVGGAIWEKTKAKVDLKNPKKWFRIEVMPKAALIYNEKIAGPGGLPVGSQGRVLVLLSGGIDSPVAAYQLAKRGAHVDFVHFHSYPMTSKSSLEKAKDLANILRQYTLDSKLFLVPFGEIQKEILKNCGDRFRVLLYRRMMLRIAEKIADQNFHTSKYGSNDQKEKALALVTGESLGQVASQTLENMTAVEEAVEMPIFRPLIGFDKEEIINFAKRIGTFETSILPHDDCCTVFLPKQPATKAKLEDILEEEKKLEIEKMMESAIKNIEVLI